MYTSVGVNSPTEHIHKLRAIKSEAEVDLMRTAGTIASEAFREVSLLALLNEVCKYSVTKKI